MLPRIDTPLPVEAHRMTGQKLNFMIIKPGFNGYRLIDLDFLEDADDWFSGDELQDIANAIAQLMTERVQSKRHASKNR